MGGKANRGSRLTLKAFLPVLISHARYLGISGSNLDEFFAKRVGGLKRQLGARKADKLKSVHFSSVQFRRHSPIYSLPPSLPSPFIFAQRRCKTRNQSKEVAK